MRKKNERANEGDQAEGSRNQQGEKISANLVGAKRERETIGGET